MKDVLLEVKKLSISYPNSTSKAVFDASFKMQTNEILGIIGESGSGKSSIALAIMNLLKQDTKITGEILYKNKNLLAMTQKEQDSYKWDKISIVFQNSLEVFNPVLTIKEQIIEALKLDKSEALAKATHYLNLVGIKDEFHNFYAHQLSGGMRQKVLIAMAISCEPELLIVDEPTMALDAIAKQEIIKLFLQLKQQSKMSILVISHELSIIQALAQNVVVMYLGHIFEIATTKDILTNPHHPYTKGLVYSSASINIFRDTWGIAGEISFDYDKGCPFYSRCTQKIKKCLDYTPNLKLYEDRQIACERGGIVKVLQSFNLVKKYKSKDKTIIPCDNCSICINSGEVYTLIGQSGSGKTTLALMLSNYLKPDSGDIVFNGVNLKDLNVNQIQKGIQMVFQDPHSSINDKLSIKDILLEPLNLLNIGSKEERLKIIKEALFNVCLPNDDGFLSRKGNFLSGGQKQRIAIARALVVKPKLLIADEISAMLDPSTAANILRLLKGLQNSEGFSMLYITHDLDLAKKISDKIAIMLDGKIIENGNAETIFTNPQHSYTKKLLSKF